MQSSFIFSTLSFLAIAATLQAGNPAIPNQGVADPHLHVFGNKAYIFAGHDFGDPNGKQWDTREWWVWSSDDMVEWKMESVLKTEDTYMKRSGPMAWAGDAAERNGKYYWYFSNTAKDTGVAVADSPGGPYRDALGKPLIPERFTPTRSYDPTLFVDDDEAKTPYLVFGGPKWVKNGDSYYIVRMNEDMLSLAETPKKIILQNPDGTINKADDKNFLHKHNGIYYLSWRSHYATSQNVYGPYTYRGDIGTTHDHASFCPWNNQWFMCYTIFDRTGSHRAPGLCYIHYKDNGEMATVEPEIKAFGVGRYEGTWENIQAEWYLAASAGTSKREIPSGGFEVRAEKDGSWLTFPKVQSLLANTPMSFSVASGNADGATIEIRKGAVDGELLGTCSVPNTGGVDVFKTVKCKLKNSPGQNDLCLVFKGSGSGELLRLDGFHFKESDEAASDDWKIKAYGAGQYEGTWEKIQAEWHASAGVGVSKHEMPGGGFDVRFQKDGSWIAFPKVNSMMTDTFIGFSVASGNRTGATIEIHKGSADGELLGTCIIRSTGSWEAFKTVKCKLKNRPGPNDLCLVVKGIGEGELLRLDWVSFK
jgi:hypothetical protein